MRVSEAKHDTRFGAAWLEAADADIRLQMIAGLLSRFNHDLRTPLNTILGWTHLLQQGAVDAARSRHVAEVIARNSREQTTLLEDFVDDGRALLNALKLEMRTIGLDTIIAGALERAAAVANLHGATLQPRIDVDSAAVCADARRFEKLLYRLIVVVARRARDESTLTIEAATDRRQFAFTVGGVAQDDNWPDAALLDLRISTVVASALGGGLEVGADAGKPQLWLHVPLAETSVGHRP